MKCGGFEGFRSIRRGDEIYRTRCRKYDTKFAVMDDVGLDYALFEIRWKVGK